MEDFIIDEAYLVELVANIMKRMKDGEVSFDNVVDFANSANRQLYLGNITTGVGSYISTYIRFWNQEDERNNVPAEERKPIKIYIDSHGGNLLDTFTLIDSIALSKTPVWTINTGAAYSGGFFTFIAGHRRIAYETSSFLYHEGACENGGDAGKFRNFAKFYERQLDQLKNIVLKYTSITEEEYEKHIKDDWWLTAEDALSLGVCDEIAKEFV